MGLWWQFENTFESFWFLQSLWSGTKLHATTWAAWLLALVAGGHCSVAPVPNATLGRAQPRATGCNIVIEQRFSGLSKSHHHSDTFRLLGKLGVVRHACAWEREAKGSQWVWCQHNIQWNHASKRVCGGGIERLDIVAQTFNSGRQRQAETYEVEASLGYIERPSLKTNPFKVVSLSQASLKLTV